MIYTGRFTIAMKLAVQLYTLRDFTSTPDGLEDCLKKVKSIGYEGVQLSAVACMSGNDPVVSASWAREMLDSLGLECAATHRAVSRLRDHLDEEIEFHHTLGCTYIAIGGASGDYGERPEDYRRFIREFTPIVARLKEAGIRFGYHNHAYEYAKDPETGNPCFDIIVNEGGEDLMLELDTYWVAHAGLDPTAQLRRGAGRIDVVHLKDREVIPKEGPVMAAVGEGLLDWDSILAACAEGGTEWLTVEQDICRRNPYDCLKSSFDFLTAKLASE